MLSESATDTRSDIPTRKGPRRRERTDRLAAGVLGTGLAVSAILAVRLARGFSFIVDEWDILAHHVHGRFLTPYNGHLSLVPVALYQGLAHTVGIDSYLPWTVTALVVFLALPIAFFLTHRGVVDPLLVAIASLGIAWSWAAEGQILYGFLVNFNLPVLLLVVTWWLIRHDTTRHDVWAATALVVALATSSVGVVVAFAVVVELLIARAPLRRLVRFAPPVVLWVTWWVFAHEATKPATFGARVSYAWHTTVAILAGFTLGWKPGAVLTAAVIAALLTLAAKRWHTVDAHVIAALATVVFFVALSAFSRAGDIALNPPDSPRYVWVGDVLLVAAMVWCVRGRRITTATYAITGAVVLVGAVALVGHMRDYRRYVLDYTARTRPFLVGAEAAGPEDDPDRILPLNLIPVTVGEYLELVRSVGSPVAALPFSSLGSEPARVDADRLLITETPVTLRSSPRPLSCHPRRPRQVRPATDTVRLAPGESLIVAAGAPTVLRLRRLAHAPATRPDLKIPPGWSALVATVTDRSPLPWWVELDGSVTSITICER